MPQLGPDYDLPVRIRQLETRLAALERAPGPWLPLPTPQPVAVSAWPSTGATVWSTIASSRAAIVRPRVHWTGTGSAPGSTTGQFRLLINGAAYGQVFTATGGTVAIAETITIPAGTTVPADCEIDLQAQVTAGTAAVSGIVTGLYGTP